MRWRIKKMVARTIDNLGYDASERYAQDQKLLDGQGRITQDAKLIFSRNSMEVTKPVFHLETDLAFHGSLKSNSWADFPSPSGYEDSKKFFTHELLPCFINQEKIEILKKKISEIQKKDQDQENSSSKKENWQQIKEEEEEEKEKEILINLLNCILLLDNCIIYVHGKRAQYHKG